MACHTGARVAVYNRLNEWCFKIFQLAVACGSSCAYIKGEGLTLHHMIYLFSLLRGHHKRLSPFTWHISLGGICLYISDACVISDIQPDGLIDLSSQWPEPLNKSRTHRDQHISRAVMV